MKKMQILKSIFLCFSSLCIFTLAGTSAYFSQIRPADTPPAEKIPKETSAPDSIGIVITDDETITATALYLDFANTTSHVFLINNKNDLSACAYPLNRSINISRSALKDLIDRFGGIVINDNDTSWRYTGTQITDMLYNNSVYPDRATIILQILYKISSKGFSKEDFLFIIEMCETDINYIDYYNCSDVLNQTLENCVIYEEEWQ